MLNVSQRPTLNARRPIQTIERSVAEVERGWSALFFRGDRSRSITTRLQAIATNHRLLHRHQRSNWDLGEEFAGSFLGQSDATM
jgi:hypothetical protein